MTTDPTTTPDPEPEPAQPTAAERTGYAVYDLTILQFVGGVTKDKPSAKAARELVAEGHDYEIRAV